MISDIVTVVLTMTVKKALELGLLFCKCGHPPNNHFEFDDQICAHCGAGECKGLKDTANLVSRQGVQLAFAA